jgi:hypothetical protein
MADRSKGQATAIDLSQGSVLRGLTYLVGHPGAEIAVFGLGLAFLHKRDAGSAERRPVAIENGEVHQAVVENMSYDRRERLSAVDMRETPVASEARRRE